MNNRRWSDELKAHQVRWARSVRVPDGCLDGANRRPWVLKPAELARNFYRPQWVQLVKGKEHRWASALTSSQAFAVNLFGPLTDDPDVAMAVYRQLAPDRIIDRHHRIRVLIEFAPDQSAAWLGEKGQTTQIDAAFLIDVGGALRGATLIEVKLGEAEFGSCRGAKQQTLRRVGNPDPARCLNLKNVIEETSRQCWLVQHEGRSYWEYLTDKSGGFDLSRLETSSPCPFRQGLYQIMRNAILAQALVRRGGAEWADIGFCLHPRNDGVRKLRAPIAGEADAIAAMRRIAPGATIREIKPGRVLRAAVAADDRLEAWSIWMKERYLLTDEQ